MRHRRNTAKLGRKGQHRNAMLANMACSLIKHRRVTTTLAKAKAVRPVVEKLITLGKKGSLHHRRLAAAKLRSQSRTLHKSAEARLAWRENEDVVRILFEDLAPSFKARNGGYTRIIKLGSRRGDAGQKAIIEWVDGESTETVAAEAPAASEETSSADESDSGPAVAAQDGEAASSAPEASDEAASEGEGK